METTLDSLQLRETCTVTSINAQKSLRRKILDMGITPGTKILLKNIAPLGDPIEITLRGYNLSIRKSEAKNVFVKKEEK